MDHHHHSTVLSKNDGILDRISLPRLYSAQLLDNRLRNPQVSLHQAKHRYTYYQVTRLREPQIIWTLASPSALEHNL